MDGPWMILHVVSMFKVLQKINMVLKASENKQFESLASRNFEIKYNQTYTCLCRVIFLLQPFDDATGICSLACCEILVGRFIP